MRGEESVLVEKKFTTPKGLGFRVKIFCRDMFSVDNSMKWATTLRLDAISYDLH